MRDRLAWRICCFALKYIATERYCRMIDGSIRYGLLAAARDTAEAESPSASPRSPFGI